MNPEETDDFQKVMIALAATVHREGGELRITDADLKAVTELPDSMGVVFDIHKDVDKHEMTLVVSLVDRDAEPDEPLPFGAPQTMEQKSPIQKSAVEGTNIQ